MDMLSQSLPVVIYFLLIVLIIIGIVIAIRLLGIMNKVDEILYDINNKLSSVNGVFNLVDTVTTTANQICNSLFGVTGEIFKKIIQKKKRKKEEDDNE